MSYSLTPSGGDIIQNPSYRINNSSYDYRYNGFSNNTVYYLYICSNSFLCNAHVSYSGEGSDNLYVYFYRYSISNSSWVSLGSWYLKGSTYWGAFGDIDTVSIRVNSSASMISITGTDVGEYIDINTDDSIHFYLQLRRTRDLWWSANTARCDLYMGGPLDCTQYSSFQDTKIYGKQSSGVLGGVSFGTSSPPSNPFDSTWGNITYASGSTTIDASDHYRAVGLYGG